MRAEDYLREGERLDDLERKGYRVIQHPKTFCFGMDAVLLSAFARILPGERAADLGTGTGIIPILMEARTGNGCYVGLEIQPEMAERASRSVALNGLEEKIRILCGDLVSASALLGRASFDVVTSNPPYMKADGGLISPDSAKAIARHELCCTMEDVAREAAALLKPGGRFYLVHRPERLTEILDTLHRLRLEPKCLRMVHPYVDSPANLFLLEAVRGGAGGMKVSPPLVIYRKPGEYTEELVRLYRD